jgi:hypothetical protein
VGYTRVVENWMDERIAARLDDPLRRIIDKTVSI